MNSQFTYGYLKEAVRAHLDLEEDELETLNINQRFHIFANEAIQQICYTKPKYQYFQFQAVSTMPKLVYDNGNIRVATTEEVNWTAHNLPEPLFVSDTETIEWYNEQHIYLVGQVITMPNDFLSFTAKPAFAWTTSISERQRVKAQFITYISNNEFFVQAAATYQIPYRATWINFKQNTEEDAGINMPTDLLLTIPIYVASICLQQRNLNMSQAKRQEFEIAVSRCKSSELLTNYVITPTFE